MSNFKVKLSSEVESYVKKEGSEFGAPTLFKKDGLYKLNCVKAEAKKDKNEDSYLAMVFIAQDDDEKGAVAYYNLWASGVHEYGPESKKGKPRVFDIFDMLETIGRQDMVVKAKKEKSLDIAEIASAINGATMHARITQRQDKEGNPASSIQYFVTGEKYDEARQTGNRLFRDDPRPPRASAPRGASTSASNGVTTGVQAAAVSVADAGV